MCRKTMNYAIQVIILVAILSLNCASARRLNTNFAELQCYSGDGRTAKHWSIQVDGPRTDRVHGRLHTSHGKGWEKETPRTYQSPQEALKVAKAMVRRKIRQGYTLVDQEGLL